MFAALGLGGFVGPLAGCSTNKVTGRSQLILMSRTAEIALGADAAPQLTQEYGGAVADEQLRGYVSGIGQRLAAATEGDNPGLPWEFTLLDSDVINAFALPGGKVFFSRGLAERLDNEAQMAAVLGHEVGHVTARHGNERISQGMVAQGLIIGAAVGAGMSDSEWVRSGVPLVVGAGGQGFLLKFGRDQESEADKLGMRYMTKIGYDPVGMRQMMDVLKAASQGERQPEFLSTHPYPETRIARIEKHLREDYADLTGKPGYELHRERYHSQFLSRLAALPPARHGAAPATAFALHDPTTWCGHCASAAAPDASRGLVRVP